MTGLEPRFWGGGAVLFEADSFDTGVEQGAGRVHCVPRQRQCWGQQTEQCWALRFDGAWRIGEGSGPVLFRSESDLDPRCVVGLRDCSCRRPMQRNF